jgi:phthalate 4,5-dioxygenase reductase component
MSGAPESSAGFAMADVPPGEHMNPLRVASATNAADDIRSFELVHPDGRPLPLFTAGAHVKVRAPNGSVRKYSLCNNPNDRRHYEITVKREAGGRGGSISLVDDVRQDDLLPTSPPENSFPLAPMASSYMFIAGGIGITPMLSMIRSFEQVPPVPWTLYYLSRAPSCTAFLGELSRSHPNGRIIIHHDFGNPEQFFDLWPVLERPTGAHIYCCGPQALMSVVRDMTGHWPSSNVHFESFNDAAEARPTDRPFAVRLARSGRTLNVPVGVTILRALRDAGCQVSSSCESGTCGTCRTGLLAGDADHRDMVLMPEEMASQIMICVSRSKADELVLDL